MIDSEAAALSTAPSCAPDQSSRNGLRLLYWCEETRRVPFECGIQRVTRRLAQKLSGFGATILPVGWNARLLQVETYPTPSDPAGRPLGRQAIDGAILFVPEIPLSLAGAGLDPIQLGRAYGLPTAALVHDLIPIKLAADYDAGAVSVYRRYYSQFASADLAFATTDYVANDLRRFLEDAHLAVPPMETIALPAELPSFARRREPPPSRRPDETLRLISVTTWEPRKNLIRLLKAVRRSQNDPAVSISLDLVGRRGGFAEHDAEVLALAEATPGVVVHGQIADPALAALYERSHVSVYPSWEEGFGMPIGESLWMGRPCLCHDGSAMAEVAPGGGALLVDMTDEAAIAEALARLAGDPDLVPRLAADAIGRPLRTWEDFATDVCRALVSLQHARGVGLQ